MSKRLKEQGNDNALTIMSDPQNRRYLDFNGAREYILTTAIAADGSTAVGAGTVPAGSLARTTHATGRGTWFANVGGFWVALAGEGGGGGGDGESIYKIYRALIKQVEEAAPDAQIFTNTFDGALTWSRNDVGFYTLTSAEDELLYAPTGTLGTFITYTPYRVVGNVPIKTEIYLSEDSDLIEFSTFALNSEFSTWDSTDETLTGYLEILVLRGVGI